MHGYVMYHQGKKMLPASWVATVKVYGCGKERGSPWLGGGGGRMAHDAALAMAAEGHDDIASWGAQDGSLVVAAG